MVARQIELRQNFKGGAEGVLLEAWQLLGLLYDSPMTAPLTPHTRGKNGSHASHKSQRCLNFAKTSAVGRLFVRVTWMVEGVALGTGVPDLRVEQAHQRPALNLLQPENPINIDKQNEAMQGCSRAALTSTPRPAWLSDCCWGLRDGSGMFGIWSGTTWWSSRVKAAGRGRLRRGAGELED